jgi:hypothetical protein
MMTVVAGFQTDLELALNWLRLKKALVDVGDTRKQNGLYIVTIKSKISRSEVQKILSDRFGHFVKVAP